MAAIRSTARTLDLPSDQRRSQVGEAVADHGPPPHLSPAAGPGGVLSNPGLHAALREMAAIGLRVSNTPHAGSTRYHVVSGRSGSRWFLLPARPRPVCAGSFSFIQPVRAAPRVLTRCAATAAQLGLWEVWHHQSVHVSGVNRIDGALGSGATHCAFFSGTAGAHRKLVMQWMDGAGRVKGYAKVACAPATRALLGHEASILQRLRGIDLRSAAIPRVLLHETIGDAAILVMDTVDAPRTHPIKLHAAHLVFLDELAARTSSFGAGDGDALIRGWNARVDALAHHLSAGWRDRFLRALHMLAADPGLIGSRGLAHGDFTPGNTFLLRDRLYVFDWEYAGGDYPADFDLNRFLGVQARTRTASPARRIGFILRELAGNMCRRGTEAHRRLLAYQFVYALRGADRQPLPPASGASLTWASERDDAAMLDALLVHSRTATQVDS